MREFDDLNIVKDIINDNFLNIDDYISLIKVLTKNKDFMDDLRSKLSEKSPDDIDSMYDYLDSLLSDRDYLATLAALSAAAYRGCKLRFTPTSGTAVDKDNTVDSKSAPYKFYEKALEERIKSLDNKCTAIKQKARHNEEAIKKSLRID